MAVFVEKTINNREYLFIVGEYDPKSGEVITGVVLRGYDDPENEDFQFGLTIAYDMAHVLGRLSLTLSKVSGMDFQDSKLRYWSIDQLGDLLSEIIYLKEQEYWSIDADELKTLNMAHRTLLSEFQRRAAIKQATSTPSFNGPGSGYVYLLQSPTGAYKIGRTRNPKDRLKTFSVKLPFEVEFICTINTHDMYELERELHERYASKRVNGEWFLLDSEDIEYIKGLAS